MTRAGSRSVRAYVCDIDGCLAAVGHAAFDLPRLDALAALSRASRDDRSVPELTFMTGRPHPYVDALMQALDVRVAASFENGAGLATRHPYRAWLAPGIDGALRDLRRLERLVDERADMFLQFGKVASATVFPSEATFDVAPLMATLAGVLEEHALELVLDPSNDCVNVLLPGVDKAAGFLRLCAELDVDPLEVAGIGDSVGDVAWLRLCGTSFAPSNASDDVRSAVTHALDVPDVEAAVLALETIVEANRRSR